MKLKVRGTKANGSMRVSVSAASVSCKTRRRFVGGESESLGGKSMDAIVIAC